MITPWDPLAHCSAEQRDLLAQYQAELRRFNQKINLISRDDVAALGLRHIRHSLALAHRGFPPQTHIVDWGTGGGLPGLPLAILFPETTFHLVDATAKKIHAVRAMVRTLGLTNVLPWHGRAEDFPHPIHYAVSRATAPLNDLWRWFIRVRPAPPSAMDPEDWQPGLLALKGGDLQEEITQCTAENPHIQMQQIALGPLLGDPFFAEKCIVHIHQPLGSR